jgi:apolipoprotein N-acyltransferase
LRPSLAAQLAAAVLAGALVVLAFPRYGFETGTDHLIWVALAPLFLAAVSSGGRRGFLLGWITGLTLESAGFIWILIAIRRFTQMPWPVTAACFCGWLLYSSLPWALLGLALGKCRRPAAVFRVLPLWVGIEHYYPRLFPWHLGGALYGRDRLVQAADLLGASGLTALVFFSSAVAYLALRRAAGRGPFPRRSSAVLVLAVAAVLAYGHFRLRAVRAAEESAPRFRAAIVQGARHPFEPPADSLRFYLQATAKALAAGPIDLAVWPEGADPYRFDLTSGRDPWGFHRLEAAAAALAAEAPAVPLVAGGRGFDAARLPPQSNVAVYIRRGQPPLFYEKNIRMPFGEWVPFLELLPRSLIEDLGIRVRTIARGRENALFPLGALSFRNLICYEAVFPGYFHRAAEGADFLVNVTEDIWYGHTAHIPQHASVLVLRAVENRISLVRATNIGPSGVVDPSGAFRRGEQLFAPETLLREVKAARLPTLYRAGGRHFPLAMLALAAGAWLLSRVGGKGPGKGVASK